MAEEKSQVKKEEEKKAEELTLSIDGQEVSVPPGTTIIKAAEKVGKFIPHFCYHPGLRVVGQCRMCFVEIEGAPKLATACSMPVAPGMKVLTESEKVKAGQNATLEFTLLNHPLDCPICDRGGECKLQDFTYEYGPPLSRMVDDKIEKDKHRPISEHIVLDQERCIVCTRCTRFSGEVDGRAELVVQNRGSADVIDVFDNRPVTSPYQGNVVDLCPVGALTATDFRFAARPWELRPHEAICTSCSNGCNIEIHTKHRHPGIVRPDKRLPNPKILRIVPRENMNVNTWWMCDKGRWGYHFHNEDEHRLMEPLARRKEGGPQGPVSLREIQLLIDEKTKGFSGNWEFWIADSFPHEGIAWARELRESWVSRGRTVADFNPNSFAAKLQDWWKSRSQSASTTSWTNGNPDWSHVKKVVAPWTYRELESIEPILALRLGPRVRQEELAWEKLEASKVAASASEDSSTAYLLPVPQSSPELESYKKIPANAQILLCWTQVNSRGLLNEGITPLEALEKAMADKKPGGPVFFFNQKTQNPLPEAVVKYLSQASFLIVADSYDSALSQKANVVLPLTPLYESQATFTNLENYRQFSRGVSLDHPNLQAIHRGGPIIHPSLRLL